MSEPSKALKLNVNLDYRWVSLALLAVVLAMLFIWKPWSNPVTDRTIDVTGTATVSATPDEFAFYPSYEFTNADKAKALEQMTAKSKEVVAGLKDLGVADKDIKTNSDSWSYPTMKLDDGSTSSTYTLTLTVTTRGEELTQKVQDYLVSTTPTGSISPQATFSEKKLKEVENEGRLEAAKDARKKADESGKNLGFRIASVKSVSDSSSSGGLYPYAAGRSMTMEATDSFATLEVQPGENDLTYTVTVTYFIR